MSWNRISSDALDPSAFTCIIDSRDALLFCDGFLSGSISLPFSENFFSLTNRYVDEDTAWLWICSQSQWDAIHRLQSPIHYPGAVWVVSDADLLQGEWNRDMLITLDLDEFEMDYRHDTFYLVDVRDAAAFAEKHVEHAENMPLDDLENSSMDLDNDYAYYVYGDNMTVAVTAGSVMKRNGLNQVRLLAADWAQLLSGNLPFVSSPSSSKT